MKSDAFFLENASWPAFLVEETGTIRYANKAAATLLGSGIEAGTMRLSSIWASDNTVRAEKFLADPQRSSSGANSLKLKVRAGSSTTFTIHTCVIEVEGRKEFLFQILAEPTKPQAGTSSAGGSQTGQAFDTSVIHKQKLDCALQLARTVALDFNNALTTILGHASLLLSKADPDHAWRGSLVEIEKSAAKAAEIATDLALFSRQEKDVKAQTSSNLNALLQRTLELFQNRIDITANVSWETHLEKKLFSTQFDEAKLQQAFVKVFENAIEAIGDRGQITVESRNLQTSEPTQDRTVKLQPGTYVCVEIKDTGPGIAPDVLPRIFEPFFTTKGQPHRGLGLAFAYGIVTNHSGGIAVSSSTGLGASVRIYLPATKKFVKETTVDTNDLFGIESILMVDDEDLLLNMGQMVLSSFGYRVLTANSGQRALEILHSGEQVDLVITDLVMPNMSGRELIDHIREGTPDMRVLCTTGYVMGQSGEEEAAYLQKPFTSQELLRKVKETLS